MNYWFTSVCGNWSKGSFPCCDQLADPRRIAIIFVMGRRNRIIKHWWKNGVKCHFNLRSSRTSNSKRFVKKFKHQLVLIASFSSSTKIFPRVLLFEYPTQWNNKWSRLKMKFIWLVLMAWWSHTRLIVLHIIMFACLMIFSLFVEGARWCEML